MITAIKDKDGVVYMAYSICEIVVDTTKNDIVLDGNSLVWKVEGRENTYFGCAFLKYSADVARYAGLFDGVKEIDGNVIIREIVPNLIDALAEVDEFDESSYSWNNMMFIVDNGNIYIIDKKFCVREVPSFGTEGYSILREMFVSIFEANKDSDMTPTEKIVEACNFFNNMRISETFPIVVINTATGERVPIYDYEYSKKLLNK